MKTGFIEPKLDSTQYIMGSATSLPKEILQVDGQWGDYLPDEERQSQPGIETFNCTSFGTLNCLEILIKKIYGKQENKSDRFLGICAKTRPPGNDPHLVIEAARKNGLIEESFLPFTNKITSVDEYYSYIGSNESECISKGHDFLDQFIIGHEWVFTGGIAKEQRISMMKQALQYSPLGVSVSGWFVQNDLYVDMGQPNNHWTMIYGYDDKGWLCFDSYAPYKKTISYDHNIMYCKRYSLTPLEVKKNWLIETIKKLILIIKPKKEVPDLVPVEPYSKSPRERFYEMAVSFLGKDASPKDIAPDEFGCAETVNEIYYSTFKEYIEDPGISTTKLFAAMFDRQDKFVRVNTAECGNIIISPTGFSSLKNTPIKNGHVGIFGKDNIIMSNSSSTGKFEENYNIYTWIDRYRIQGGYPIYYFKVI